MPHGITEVIAQMVQESDRPAKALARELGKPYSTFMRELSGNDSGAKFGVEQLLPLMQACDSVLPLRYLAARMGCRVAALENAAPGRATLHEELLDSYDAMTSNRPYRSALPLEQAIEEIRREGGCQFDPAMVRAFIESGAYLRC